MLVTPAPAGSPQIPPIAAQIMGRYAPSIFTQPSIGQGMSSLGVAPLTPNGYLNDYLVAQAQRTLANPDNENSNGLLQMALARKAILATELPYLKGTPAPFSNLPFAKGQQVPFQQFTLKGANPGAPEDMAAAKLASQYLGTPYVYGGSKPGGFDCSGLLQYVFARQGVNIPRTTYDQWKAGTPTSLNNLKVGDAIFFKGSDSRIENGRVLPGHVAIYIGNGKVIQAPHTGTVVQITPLSKMGPIMGARTYHR